MRILKWIFAVCLSLFCLSAVAHAGVNVDIDMSTQTMHVRAAGGESYDWPVSTAGRGYITPHGTFGVQSMQTMHRSRKYHNSPMPHSIFFSGGFAIHGTTAEAHLGRPASHGCVRLSRANAATLFALVKREGGARIALTGTSPTGRMLAVNDGHHGKTRVASHKSHSKTVMAANHHRAAPLAYAAPAPQPKSLFQWLASPGM
eukprot:gene2563-2601_t